REVDAPVEPGLRARDAEIPDRLPEHRQDLATVAVRSDALGLGLVQRQHALLVLLHAEEVVLLRDLGGGDEVIRAQAADQLALLVEALAAVAVQAAVGVEVDVAAGMDLAQDALHERHVGRVRGADEPADLEPERVPRRAKDRAYAIGEYLRHLACLRGRARHLVAMLVGAGDEGRISVALAPLPA